MTNTVVRTTLRNDLSPEGIIHYLKILSPIHCAFQNDLLTSSGYTPEWGVYTVIEDLHGAGSFVTEMQLFIGDSPIPQNYTVSASDDVKIEVGLYKQKSNLKVVLTECWATPSSNARDPVMFGFINNSCPIPNTHTNVIENGNSNKAQFKLKIFSFINNSIVYLHCKLRICMESPGTTCKIVGVLLFSTSGLTLFVMRRVAL
ncbi:uromodulin-like 1 [Pontoporia blainvillei]|uniref:Uromodulin-like 1 n=1 Tax=Pontoporia blainvillei TaxID=48723 RepID=A0ABX0RZ29_PONBL|nr:uromodulin-like 1 [Pontoporia blainvillei]